jgi:hypothetical protein
MYTMPLDCTLDEVIGMSDKLEGLNLETLKPCDTIHARTRNSDYEIFLLDPECGRALVKGGKYFVEPVEATMVGSTFGGSMLKMGWLGVGLRMEFNANGRYVMTSPVKELRVEHESLGLGSSIDDSNIIQR